MDYNSVCSKCTCFNEKLVIVRIQFVPGEWSCWALYEYIYWFFQFLLISAIIARVSRLLFSSIFLQYFFFTKKPNTPKSRILCTCPYAWLKAALQSTNGSLRVSLLKFINLQSYFAIFLVCLPFYFRHSPDATHWYVAELLVFNSASQRKANSYPERRKSRTTKTQVQNSM